MAGLFVGCEPPLLPCAGAKAAQGFAQTPFWGKQG